MNQANLQIEGLLMAVVALNRMLVERGVVSAHEVEAALRRAEAHITSDGRFQDEDKPLANRDAMGFRQRRARHFRGVIRAALHAGRDAPRASWPAWFPGGGGREQVFDTLYAALGTVVRNAICEGQPLRREISPPHCPAA